MYRSVINKKVTALYQDISNLPFNGAYISMLYKKLRRLENANSLFPSSSSRLDSQYRDFAQRILSDSFEQLKINLGELQTANNLFLTIKISPIENIKQLEAEILEKKRVANEVIEAVKILLSEIGQPKYFIIHHLLFGSVKKLRESTFNDVSQKMELLMNICEEFLAAISEYYVKIKTEHKKQEEIIEEKTDQLQVLIRLQRAESQADQKQHEMQLQEIELKTKLCQEEQTRLQALQKKYAEDEAKILAEKKKIAQQNFPLTVHLEGCMNKMQDVTEEELKGSTLHTRMVQVYKAIQDTLAHFKLTPADKLALVPKDVERLNQIEVVLDLYDEKIRRVRKDTVLDEIERAEKIEYWKRLRDRDIALIEE